MITHLKYFYDTLNIVVILAPGREFCSTKCAQFPLTFTEGNSTKDIFPLEMFIIDI